MVNGKCDICVGYVQVIIDVCQLCVGYGRCDSYWGCVVVWDCQGGVRDVQVAQRLSRMCGHKWVKVKTVREV